jgi:molybdate transport system substrate-binding protein
VTVSAAASLKDALTAIKESFARAHSDVELMFNFGASGTLQVQIEQGAPADVFISAAPQQMDALAAKGLILADTRADLLRNELVLIVPADSKSVTGFSDLGKQDVRVVAVGDPRSVPAGAYAQQVLAALGLADAVKTKTVLGTDVRQVLADVETASADAGLVYATDAAISTRVRVVADAPANSHMPIVYPVAVLKGSTHPDAARILIQYLHGAEARAIFQKYGFRPVT